MDSSTRSIQQRFISLIVVFVAVCVALSLVYLYKQSIDESLKRKRAAIVNTELLIESVRFDLVELNRELFEYILFARPSVIEQQKATLAGLVDKINRLDAKSNEIRVAAEFNDIKSLLDKYYALYQMVTNQYEQLDDKSEKGLRSEISSISSQFEDVLFKLDTPNVITVALNLRQSVQFFLFNPDSSLLTPIDSQIRELMSILTTADLTREDAELVMSLLSNYSSKLSQLSSLKDEVIINEQDLTSVGEALIAAMSGIRVKALSYARSVEAELTQKAKLSKMIFLCALFVAISLLLAAVVVFYKNVIAPLAKFKSAIERVASGDSDVRVESIKEGELGDIANAFNTLLDEKGQSLISQSMDNEYLNDSIVALINKVGAIAKQKDLTIKLPSTEGIAGTISDAINLLTTETSKTFSRVKSISAQINAVSRGLQLHSSVVARIANDERKQVVAISKTLDLSAKAMMEIASRSETASAIADEALLETIDAQEAVIETEKGIRRIRETISETEKRIKRLGERSQEISGSIALINAISERTHILALNASMQASAAGEAGKNFLAVAEEVKRLSENAGKATEEITLMVNNIKVETSDTVLIMNRLISDVVAGTHYAEQAGSRMTVTESATRQLVETVQSIAVSSGQQAHLLNKVKDRANIIRRFTDKTVSELSTQKRHTDTLKNHAEVLVEQVNIFKTPNHILPSVKASQVEEAQEEVAAL